MPGDVSFAIHPDGLEDVISAMTATVAVVPYVSTGRMFPGHGHRSPRTVADGSSDRFGGMARYGVGRTAASKDSRLLSGESTGFARRTALQVDLSHRI